MSGVSEGGFPRTDWSKGPGKWVPDSAILPYPVSFGSSFWKDPEIQHQLEEKWDVPISQSPAGHCVGESWTMRFWCSVLAQLSPTAATSGAKASAQLFQVFHGVSGSKKLHCPSSYSHLCSAKLSSPRTPAWKGPRHAPSPFPLSPLAWFPLLVGPM